MLEDRGALPKEDGDQWREYKASRKQISSAVGRGRVWKAQKKEGRT